jgi:uridylate kinase
MTGYRRVLLKLSGQALAGPERFGLHPPTVRQIAAELRALVADGRQVAVVIGAGNLFRGAAGAEVGMDRVTGDHMGMIATVMNCLALHSALTAEGGHARVMSAIPMTGVAEPFDRIRAVETLEEGRVLLLGGGTGNPWFTTDSAAALRAAELGADLLMKGTRVDGVYDRDPEKHRDAVRHGRLTYAQVLRDDLRVMDTAAFAICRDAGVPIVVFDVHGAGNLLRVARGEDVGTWVGATSRA